TFLSTADISLKSAAREKHFSRSRTFLTVFWLWMIRKWECAAEFPCGFLAFCTDFDTWGDGSFAAVPGAAEHAEIYFNYDAA
ncbi:MAG: hypothetical protein IIW12_08670, partial [Oscillospiraceae bacterium]|nr:hypothetical protein [Oscillospiraceae bacterium]